MLVSSYDVIEFTVLKGVLLYGAALCKSYVAEFCVMCVLASNFSI
jgi:hypothetical protein